MSIDSKKNIKRINEDLSQRASQCIAHGALTNSKRPESFVKGVYPVHLKKGKGAHVWDMFDNKYIDLICGLGTNLLGYANEEITQAICDQAKLGSSLSLGTELEVRVAEKLKEMFPFIEKLRFLKTGTEACAAAVRIGRAYYGKERVSSQGFHGWSDDFVSLTNPALGVPKRSWMSSLNGYDSTGENTVVILEPVITDISDQRQSILESYQIRGGVIIFDEIITGFRFPNWSVANHWNIYPDLICLGKAIAGGMPLAVVGGKAEIMDSDYFVSSTYAGETLSLAAALKSLELLQNKFKIEELWDKAGKFVSQVNALWPDNGIWLEGYPTRSVLRAKDELTKALFMQECLEAGILVGPSVFFNFCHMELFDEMLSIFKDIVTRIRTGSVTLKGELPKSPFAEKVRNS